MKLEFSTQKNNPTPHFTEIRPVRAELL